MPRRDSSRGAKVRKNRITQKNEEECGENLHFVREISENGRDTIPNNEQTEAGRYEMMKK